MEDYDDEGPNPYLVSSQEQNLTAYDLNVRLRSLRNCYNLMRKHGSALQETISDIESCSEKSQEDMTRCLQLLNEKAMLFGIASHAMMHSCNRYLRLVEYEGNRSVKIFNFERAKNRRLEKVIKDVAKQHADLERRSKHFSQFVNFSNADQLKLLSPEVSDDETKLSDDEKEENNIIEHELLGVDSLAVIRQSVFLQPRRSSYDHRTKFSDFVVETEIPNSDQTVKQRRNRVPDRPNVSINTWAIIKSSIGKDLSKIPLPVNFNEPLSMLQRITEELEYAELLDVAAKIENICEQLAYVAAFTISAYSSTADRLGKPFNPLLAETYECDRTEDLGWRSIAEQVSHHPPISALYSEGRDWIFGQEFGMKSKFRGKNLQVVPYGSAYCYFAGTGTKYTWGKVTTMVNNIIVGKMWIDQQGDVEINGIERANGVKCILTYLPHSLFAREQQKRVKGIVRDARDVAKWVVQGYWDALVEIAPILSTHNNGNQETYNLGTFTTIWKRKEFNPECEKYYFLPQFACQLNELEEGVAPTDSRLRPDLRLMEQGMWDESNCEKLRLEQKQRSKRRGSVESQDSAKGTVVAEEHSPVWFERFQEGDKVIHFYRGKYWDAKKHQNWPDCPDIF